MRQLFRSAVRLSFEVTGSMEGSMIMRLTEHTPPE
jgi:hypothetical protein